VSPVNDEEPKIVMANRKSLNDPRKLPFRTAPGIVPEELVGKKFPCESCGVSLEVPWLDKLSFPSRPIVPNSGDGHWVPASIPLRCKAEECAHVTNIKVPIREREATWTLYGDEAGRYFDEPHSLVSKEPLHFFCITLAGLHKDSWDAVAHKIQEAKVSVRPKEDPGSWRHHFTQIWGSSPEHKQFDLPTKDAKIEYGRRFAGIISEARPALVSFNISSCIVVPRNSDKRKKAINQQKQEMFSQAILSSLQEMRKHKKGVQWVFDNIKDSSSKTPTEGWASECFLGLQYTRIFTWLCAGATTLEPKFVKPGSHFLLEIADFISYCVAREFLMAAKSTQTEFPSSMLGEGFYQGTVGDGSVCYKWSDCLPIKEFYGL
jgi:hypothetical protein